jgi:hypothetical protein
MRKHGVAVSLPALQHALISLKTYSFGKYIIFRMQNYTLILNVSFKILISY